MARLREANWSPEVTDARLRFLREAAYFVPPGLEEEPGERRNEERRPARATDYRALLAAADLAFAVDRTEFGVQCVRDAVAAAWALEDTAGSEVILLGSVVGAVQVRAFDEGFAVLLSGPAAVAFNEGISPLRRYPSNALTPEGVEATLDLALASLASGERFASFIDAHRWERTFWLPTREPLVSALLAFSDIENRFEIVLRSLSLNSMYWSSDLDLHQRDQFHWEHARVRGSLIDVRRLAFEVAVQRRADVRELLADLPARALFPELRALDEFVRQLASELPNARSG